MSLLSLNWKKYIFGYKDALKRQWNFCKFKNQNILELIVNIFQKILNNKCNNKISKFKKKYQRSLSKAEILN